MANAPANNALSPYRVIDLSTERAWLCGRLLADLGATVTKVEPPGGDPGRWRGLFAGDRSDPERSLRWWAFNRGKRSVTLDLETDDGRQLLRRLVVHADVIIESFDPGWMAARGLAYEDLAAVNPAIVHTSVTSFGSVGPHAHFCGPDLVLAAMGGPLWLTGDTDRPPVRMAVPQYHLHASAEAAVHTMVALYHAAGTGRGQHVDVSGQLAAIRTLMNATGYPSVEDTVLSRQGAVAGGAHSRFRQLYPCADGHVSVMGGGGVGLSGFVRWMGEEEGLSPWLAGIDWSSLDLAAMVRTEEGAAFFARVSDELAGFFAKQTKAQLYEQALARRLLLAPVNTVADIAVDPQLENREYFVAVDQGEPVRHPGPWARLSATPLRTDRRAPLIGEHNRSVWAEELGLPLDELVAGGIV